MYICSKYTNYSWQTMSDMHNFMKLIANLCKKK